MATWAKENVIFRLVVWSTGVADTTTHTVVLQPTDQTYPTGSISCTHAGNGYYRPDSDLNDTKHYYIYVDTVKKSKLISIESEPAILT